MPLFTLELLKNTLALLGMVWLGVAGAIEGVEVTPQGVVAQSGGLLSFAVGGVAYYGYRGRDNKKHELGHLQHEDHLGLLYLPVVGLSSAVGNVLVVADLWEPTDYYGMWTEREADRLGGVTR